jgi:hypothetical protein
MLKVLLEIIKRGLLNGIMDAGRRIGTEVIQNHFTEGDA